MYPLAQQWFNQKKWQAHPFQEETWEAIMQGKSGLLNAPTGCGKTLAIWFGVLQSYQNQPLQANKNKLHALWITPLRALSKEIVHATNEVSQDLKLNYKIELRTGDTSTTQRAKQKLKPPHALVTTPESIHLLFSSKGYVEFFKNVEFVIVDEWHELMGSKRGVQMELIISKLRVLNPNLKVWGISATIGNLNQAKDILLHNFLNTCIVKANIKKDVIIETLLPDVIEKYSWAGHLGLKMLPKILPIIQQSKSTLIFTNTRSQCEIWYQNIIENAPELSGQIALHHGSLSDKIRKWVEDNLHTGLLKVVIATSSLDLGVDFNPVDTVIQIGSPKGIARLLQRAGRSGHQPGAVSKLFYLPTNTLEIIDGAAIKQAIENNDIEEVISYVQSFDVLIQYLVTLAVSDGFYAKEIFTEIQNTFAYQFITWDEFANCLDFITIGGQALHAYDEFHKVVIENDKYTVTSKAVATMHRLSMGTIVSSSMMQVKYFSGKRLGVIEEWFISRLSVGDVFWFAGKNLEITTINNMEVLVKKSNAKNGTIPSWMGGRMSFSSPLSDGIREQIDLYTKQQTTSYEMEALKPLLAIQETHSHVPNKNELLIEQLETKDGYHIFIYPFEGRNVHEGMAAIMAQRIGLLHPITFSIAMNDFGFELLSDTKVNMDDVLDNNLFTDEKLYDDAIQSMNATEMAKRKFRDIASIAGLVFNGYPGKVIKTKHVQASSQLYFKVFQEYEKDNLLLKQAYQEVMDFQLDIQRMQLAFKRINAQQIIVKQISKPSPFSFPMIVDRLREKFTNEPLEARIQKMIKAIEK